MPPCRHPTKNRTKGPSVDSSSCCKRRELIPMMSNLTWSGCYHTDISHTSFGNGKRKQFSIQILENMFPRLFELSAGNACVQPGRLQWSCSGRFCHGKWKFQTPRIWPMYFDFHFRADQGCVLILFFAMCSLERTCAWTLVSVIFWVFDWAKPFVFGSIYHLMFNNAKIWYLNLIVLIEKL